MKGKKPKRSLLQWISERIDAKRPPLIPPPRKSWVEWGSLKTAELSVRGTAKAVKAVYYGLTPEQMPDPRYESTLALQQQMEKVGLIDIDDAVERIYAQIAKPLTIYRAIIRELITPELTPPAPPHDEPIAHAKWRDQARRYIDLRHSGRKRLTEPILAVINEISKALPPPSNSKLRLPITDFLPNVAATVERVVDAFDQNYPSLRERIRANLLDERGQPVLPTKSKLDPRDIPGAYLRGTPLLKLFTARIPFLIAQDKRFEHAWVLSGTGFGKTTLLASFIEEDIAAIRRGERSAIVIDSQNTIIPALSYVDVPKVIINPKDIDYPLALNIFDVGLDKARSKEHYRALLNGALSMFNFIISSLFDQPMTPRQKGVFEYIAEFLITDVQNATIDDFVIMLEPKRAVEKFAPIWINSRPALKRFFAEEYKLSDVRKTLYEVAPRIRPLLRNDAFSNLFSAPKSKFDLSDEINTPKLILVNADKNFLQPDGCKLFERFWISQINQAAIRRSAETKKLPCYVYIDECQDALEGGDRQIENILDQARKQNIGLMLLHHRTPQLRSDSLVEALDGSTSIKLTGKLTSSDLPKLAKMMNTTQEHLSSQKRRQTFALYVDPDTPHPVTMAFPNTVFAKELSDEQFSVMLAANRAAYCYQPQTTTSYSHTPSEEADDDETNSGLSEDY